MTTNTQIQSNETHRAKRGWVGGVILILVGGLALLSQFVNFDERIVLVSLSAIFLAWGVLTRKTGLVIPGGILSGVTLGSYLVEGPFAHMDEPKQGGLFLLGFAAGWFLITLVSFYTNANHRPSLWPLIPGGIIGMVGGLMVAGGQAMKVLELLGQGWPVILIAVGLYMIFRRKEIVD